jgi:hypothetical protein
MLLLALEVEHLVIVELLVALQPLLTAEQLLMPEEVQAAAVQEPAQEVQAEQAELVQVRMTAAAQAEQAEQTQVIMEVQAAAVPADTQVTAEQVLANHQQAHLTAGQDPVAAVVAAAQAVNRKSVAAEVEA